MLSAMAPHGREMSQDLRKKIISLDKKGEGYKKISKALLISQNTVAEVVQTFKKDGTATISQRRPGRPRKLTPRQERLLMRRVEENRHASSLQLSKEVESQTGVTISRDTIRRTLQRNGMHGCRPRKKPLLKPRHKKARLEFARAHADKDEDYWDSILWSDETKINVFVQYSNIKIIKQIREVKNNIIQYPTSFSLIVFKYLHKIKQFKIETIYLVWLQNCMASQRWGIQRKMHGAYSETWWWQCPYVGLHECCWCRGAAFHWWHHEFTNVLLYTEREDATITPCPWSSCTFPTWQWS